MIDDKCLDDILNALAAAHLRKTDMKLAKAQAELETLKREDTAYFDGAYDAIKEIKKLLPPKEET